MAIDVRIESLVVLLRAHARSRMHAETRTDARARSHAETRTHARKHARSRAHTHTDTHVHTHACTDTSGNAALRCLLVSLDVRLEARVL